MVTVCQLHFLKGWPFIVNGTVQNCGLIVCVKCWKRLTCEPYCSMKCNLRWSWVGGTTFQNYRKMNELTAFCSKQMSSKLQQKNFSLQLMVWKIEEKIEAISERNVKEMWKKETLSIRTNADESNFFGFLTNPAVFLFFRKICHGQSKNVAKIE